MARKKVEGICGICGNFGQLTYEHIPPRAAFNTGKFISIPSEKAYNLCPGDFPKGPIFQGGIGMHSICGKCNNLTGHRYGTAFVELAYQGAMILQQSKYKPSLIYPFHLYPLRVLKQIISMFLSVNHDFPFQEMYPELPKFVINRDEKYLDPKYKIYIYYNHEGTTRFHKWAQIGDLKSQDYIKLTEISYPPFGFLLTLDNSLMTEKRLYDISFFSKFSYNEWADVNLQLNVLPTHLHIPFDYRSKDEILTAIDESENYIKSKSDIQNNSSLIQS